MLFRSDRVLADTVRVALDEGLLAEAEEALAALSRPEPELAQAVDRLRSRTIEALELAAVGRVELRERDVRPGLRGFAKLVALMAITTALVTTMISGDDETSMRSVVLTDLVAGSVVFGGALALRNAVMSNRRSRATTAAIVLYIVGTTTCDALCLAAGQSVRQAAPFMLLMESFGFAAIAVLLEMPMRARRVTGFSSALLCGLAFWSVAQPSVANTLTSLSVIQAFLTAGYLVFDMERERRQALVSRQTGSLERRT